MNTTDWIGFVGVFILLLAYLLDLLHVVSKEGRLYLFLNLTGAMLACFASVLLHYWPFIILEGAWAAVSLFALLKNLRR